LWQLFDKLLLKTRLKAARSYFSHPTGDNRWLVNLFTVKNDKLDQMLDNICKIAKQKSLEFKRPEIRMVRKYIGEKIIVNGQIVGSAAGKAFGGELILIFAKYLDKFSDMELAVVIAHEFGHIIDVQTKRAGHPLFEAIKHLDLDSETFAFAVASYIYSKLVVIPTSKKCNFLINESVILRLNLNV
jgi:hypothetical protein